MSGGEWQDDFDWLKRYLEASETDASMPSYQGFPTSYYGSPAPLSSAAPFPRYSSPHPYNQPAPQGYMSQPTPQNYANQQTHQPQTYMNQPPPPQNYVTSSNIMHYQPPASLPAHHGPNPSPNPTSSRQSTGQGNSSLLSTFPSSNPPAKTSISKISHSHDGHDGHDAKRRRVEPPALSSSAQPAKPIIHNPGQFSSYNYMSKDPTDRRSLKYRVDVISPIKNEDAADKLSYDPSTIARDVLIATGRHPTENPLNHHLIRLRDAFTHVDMTSDLESFRWDLVDADHATKSRDLPSKNAPPNAAAPAVTAAAAAVPRPAPQPKPPVNNSVTLPPQLPPQPPPPPPTQHQPPQPSPQILLPVQQPKQQEAKSFQQLKSVNLSPQLPQVQVQAQAQAQPQPQPQPKPKPQAKPKAQSQAPQPRQTGPQVLVQSPGTPMTAKRKPGRPPGSTNKVPAVSGSPRIPYQVYSCHWNNCQAELHNLDSLKKHIFKTHVSHSMTCAWRGCTNTDNLPAADLFKHVKKDHVQKIAWKLGDGPSVAGTGRGTPGGSPGPFTIPESNQPQTEDSLIFPASSTSIRAFNQVHGNNTQDDKAREILKAVQRLKEQIGVGLDPGGCQLATPTRNALVSKEEDVYEVVRDT